MRGGERVHHGREPPGQQPIPRTARLAGDQHQHRQTRPQRAQVGRRQVQPCGPGREPRTPTRNGHHGDPPGAGHTRRGVPRSGERLVRPGHPHRPARRQLGQVHLVGCGDPQRRTERRPVAVEGVDLHDARPEHRHHRDNGQREAHPPVAAPRPPEADRDRQNRDPHEDAGGQEVGERAEHDGRQTDGRGDDDAGDNDQRHLTQPPHARPAHQQAAARDRPCDRDRHRQRSGDHGNVQRRYQHGDAASLNCRRARRE